MVRVIAVAVAVAVAVVMKFEDVACIRHAAVGITEANPTEVTAWHRSGQIRSSAPNSSNWETPGQVKDNQEFSLTFQRAVANDLRLFDHTLKHCKFVHRQEPVCTVTLRL